VDLRAQAVIRQVLLIGFGAIGGIGPAVEDAFGDDIDYAQLVKLYGDAPEAFKGRYSPADCIG
jgi:hypothetical protein